MRPRQSRTPPSTTLRLPARGRLHHQCKCLLFLGSHLTLKCVSVPQCGPHYKYDSSGCYGWGRPRQSLQMFRGLFKNCGSERQLWVWLKVLLRVCSNHSSIQTIHSVQWPRRNPSVRWFDAVSQKNLWLILPGFTSFWESSERVLIWLDLKSLFQAFKQWTESKTKQTKYHSW